MQTATGGNVVTKGASYLLVRSTNSSSDHSRLVTPAAMVGVTCNVLYS